jgi:hypothetical protein
LDELGIEQQLESGQVAIREERIAEAQSRVAAPH